MAPPGPKTVRRGRGNFVDEKPNALARLLPVIVLSTVSWSLSRFVVQPLFGHREYYIDEEFHVPQAQRYCRAAFHEWDPKITTLPGLYLLSAAVLVPTLKTYYTILSLLGISDNDYDVCSLGALRAINAIGAPACLFYAYRCCQQLLLQNENKKKTTSEWPMIIRALSVSTFPVIYAPYSMLYYTDPWSTASVFLWYSSHLNNQTNLMLKVLLGGFCILCRQTNIAWLVFASIIDVCRCAEQCFPAVKHSVSTFSYIQACITELFDCCITRKNNKTKKLIEFIKKCWQATYPNIIVIVSFVLFVILLNNGDIVVGDRNSHVPRFHPMQLCYFSLFALAFSLPWLLSQSYFKIKTSKYVSVSVSISKIVHNILYSYSKVTFIFLLIVISGLVYLNTMAHPFLLADNRHYTFYVWRLFFGPGKPVFLRYLAVPLYLYSLYFLNTTLTHSSIAYKLAYWIVTPLVLCAQFLLEPRYFVVPYLMYRLHCDKSNIYSYSLKVALIECIAYQVCNFVVLWIFLYRPYISTMDNTGRLDRFTW